MDFSTFIDLYVFPMGSRDWNGWGQLLCGRAFMAGNRMGIGFAWFGRNESLSNLLPLSGLNQPFRVALSEKQLPLKHIMGGQVSAGCGGSVPANHTCTCLPQRTSVKTTRRLDTATRHRVQWKTSRQGNGSVKRISVGAKALCDLIGEALRRRG